MRKMGGMKKGRRGRRRSSRDCRVAKGLGQRCITGNKTVHQEGERRESVCSSDSQGSCDLTRIPADVVGYHGLLGEAAITDGDAGDVDDIDEEEDCGMRKMMELRCGVKGKKN